MWFLEFLLYLVLVFGLILYVLGLIGGGLKNEAVEAHEEGEHEDERRPGALGGILGFIQTLVRDLDGIADKVRTAGDVVCLLASIALMVLNLWDGGWTFSNFLWVVLFGGSFAYFLFDLYASIKQKKARGVKLARRFWYVLGAFAAIVFILVSVLHNNRQWQEEKIGTQSVTVGSWSETVRYVKTPNLTYLDAQKWDDDPCTNNPDLTGYEFKCEGGKFLLRAQIGKMHSFNAASGEYDSLEDIVLAHTQAKLNREHRAEELQGKPPKPEGKPWTTAERLRAFFAGMIALALLLMFIWRKREAKPEAKKTTASAAPAAPAHGGH